MIRLVSAGISGSRGSCARIVAAPLNRLRRSGSARGPDGPASPAGGILRRTIAAVAAAALVLTPATLSRAARAPQAGQASAAPVREVDLIERQERSWRRLAASICTGCITPGNSVRPVSYERVPLATLLRQHTPPAARTVAGRSRTRLARLHRTRRAYAHLRKGIRRRYVQAAPRLIAPRPIAPSPGRVALRQAGPSPAARHPVRRSVRPRLATAAPTAAAFPIPDAGRILVLPPGPPEPLPGDRPPEAVLPDGAPRARRL